MNLTQVIGALKDIYNAPLEAGEHRKIVFWMDKEKEFAEDIEQIVLDGVTIHTLTDCNQFYTKFLLEVENPAEHYLIYTNEELTVEENWLADTVLYSTTFYADRVSILLSDLGIDASLRAVVKKYKKFFDSKERIRKFRAFEIESYTEETIELAMMSVLSKVKTPDFEEVLKAVLKNTLDDADNKYLMEMEKFFDVDTFWKHTANRYGYEQEQRTLKTLFIHLAVTAFSHSVPAQYLDDLAVFISSKNRTNSVVFIDRWMHHNSDSEVFDAYAELVENEVQLPRILQSVPVEQFKQAETFAYVDRAIIMYIANSLLEKREDFEEYTKLINLRRVKHFYEQYKYVYEALYYTVRMQAFRKEFSHGIPFGTAVELFTAYENRYYVMDLYYRKFYAAYDEENNHELLKKLKGLVEHLYTNWFMAELSTNWLQAVQAEMTEQWSLPGVMNQQRFYSSIVSPHLRKGERVFVLISDAMRYEIGAELAERLNSETFGTCEIEPLLGVVPSVTKLGMASLLPYHSIDLDESCRVLVNGKSSAGLENRKLILRTVEKESAAVHVQDLFSMTKAQRREQFNKKKLVYIYHDTIDAVGDNASTEMYVFSTVNQAISQLQAVVNVLRNDLSAANIYITADHGFLYQREPLQESDKAEKEEVHALEVKRRYMLSKERQEVAGQTAIDLSSVIANELGFAAYVPNGTTRNRMQGTGANFVHGGASLQEVAVPLLTFKNRRRGQKDFQEISKVDVRLTSTARQITNSIFSLDFFQTEKVGEKMKARTVVIYIADEDGTILSNEERVIADRTSSNPADRTYKLQFVMKNSTYDRKKTYYLFIRDEEVGAIIEKVPFIINLGFVGDFDF